MILIAQVGGAPLTSEKDFGWPILAGLVYAPPPHPAVFAG